MVCATYSLWYPIVFSIHVVYATNISHHISDPHQIPPFRSRHVMANNGALPEIARAPTPRPFDKAPWPRFATTRRPMTTPPTIAASG